MLKQIALCSSIVWCLLVTTSAEAAEVCGDGQDNDADGLADEGCTAVVCENPLSCSDTGMVSPKTGALSYRLPPDISPKVPYGPGIGFSRTYQSQFAPGGGAPAYRKALGERWTHSYASWLTKDTVPNPDQIILHMSHGRDTLLKFTSTVSGWDEYRTFQPGFKAQYLRQRVASPNEYQLKLLTGETIVYNSSGKLIEIWDTLATPNKVTVTYDFSGMTSTVLDAKNTRRLLFGYTGSLMTSVAFQIYLSGAWTTQHTTSYTYTSSNLTTVTLNSQLTQTNVYTSNYLTQIQDASGNSIVAFNFDSTTAGQLQRVDTTRGMVGFEYNSSRAACSGKTVVLFNVGDTTSCSIDSDCGSGFLCGGKTGSGATGRCFRGGRCLTLSSPSEDVVTTVEPLGPPSQTCDGACTDVGEYVWTTGTSTLDLKATKDPNGNFTSRAFNSDGLPMTITYGDSDSDPTTGGTRTEYLTYDTTFPGKVASVRRQSELHVGACSASVDTGCVVTTFAYNSDGLLSSKTINGNTIDTLNAVQKVGEVTAFTYNGQGQITLTNGPLAGSDDGTVFEYWSASGTLQDGFVQYVKRKKAPAGFGPATFVTTSSLAYDFWGHATGLLDPDGTVSCLTYDTSWGRLTQRREAMNGQTTCVTSNSADLVTTLVRDSVGHITQSTRPDGSCVFREFDSKGRLIRTKRRDDCNAGSAGDKQEFSYDTEGLLIKIESFDSSSVVTWRREMTYYDSRRLAHVINPTATSTYVNFVYDDRGYVVEVDGESSLSKTVYTINADDRVTAVIRNKTATTTDTWTLINSWLGSQVSVTDGDSKVTGSVRDDFGRVVRTSSPDLTGGTMLSVYSLSGRMTNRVDADGGAGERLHSFTFDKLGRPLNDDHPEANCTSAEIQRIYDEIPSGACPAGATCTSAAARTNGRLAYIKASLFCTTTGDHSLDQETVFFYDDAGRTIREYIKDDTGRTANQTYSWTKNGALVSVTMPSGAVHGWTYGSTGSNSDTDLVTETFRTSTSTPITDTVLWNPFGPLKQYNHRNTFHSDTIRTRIGRDLAYRFTQGVVETTTSTELQRIDLTYDAKGRVTLRDYVGTGQTDSHFLYDQQDRVLCETSSYVSSCPTTGGSTIKNSHSATSPFTSAGDWQTLLRPIPGSTAGYTHVFNTGGYGSSHQVVTVGQTDGTPTFETTTYHYDAYGNRDYDVNTGLAHDRRDYMYDSRNNLANVLGEYKTGGSWHDYDLDSAFDARGRRVFKSFYDVNTSTTSTWFYYYDPIGRLTEVRYTPDSSVTTTYSIFELYWLGDRLMLYWQTDYPSATTTKRYVGTDETNRPIDMLSWPASGDTTRVWMINPTAWGVDTNLVGPAVFQPILFAGQYVDPETTAWLNDGTTVHRPGLAQNWFRTYDPFTGGYLQVDPLVPETWSSYDYAGSDPVGKKDPTGLMMRLSCVSTGDSTEAVMVTGGCCNGFGDCWDCTQLVETIGQQCGWYNDDDGDDPWNPDEPDDPTGSCPHCDDGGGPTAGGVNFPVDVCIPASTGIEGCEFGFCLLKNACSSFGEAWGWEYSQWSSCVDKAITRYEKCAKLIFAENATKAIGAAIAFWIVVNATPGIVVVGGAAVLAN